MSFRIFLCTALLVVSLDITLYINNLTTPFTSSDEVWKPYLSLDLFTSSMLCLISSMPDNAIIFASFVQHGLENSGRKGKPAVFTHSCLPCSFPLPDVQVSSFDPFLLV